MKTEQEIIEQIDRILAAKKDGEHDDEYEGLEYAYHALRWALGEGIFIV